MADLVNSGFGVPLEYQTELEALAKRRAMAAALARQASQPIQVQQMGRMASKVPFSAVLAQVLGGYAAGKTEDQADKQQQEAATRVSNEARQEMGDLTGMQDPQARIAAALVSRFPGIRAQGQLWQKTLDDRVKAGAEGAFKGEDTAGGMKILQTGQLPTDYSLPIVPAPRIEPVPGGPDGQVMAVTTNRKGEQKVDFNVLPHKVSATANAQGGTATLPGQKKGFEEWAKAAVEDNQKMGQSARSAAGLVQTLTQMGVLDKAGVISGPLANPATWLTNLANSAGLKVMPETLANTQAFNSLAQESVQQLIGQYGGNRGVTKEEAAQIAQSLPQLQQSPEARKLLSTILINVANRRQEEYAQSTRNLETALKNEDIKAYSFGSVQVPGTPLVAPTPAVGQRRALPPGVREVK